MAAFFKFLREFFQNLYPRIEDDVKDLPMNRPDKRERLYDVSFGWIGKDASPFDRAPDELACVETISELIQEAAPEINFPLLLSTRELYDYFERSMSFYPVKTPMFGDIMLAVTGTGNGTIKHGHVAIVGKYDAPDGTKWAMSNDSRTGTFEINYSIASFTRYFQTKGGMSILFYRIV